MEDVLKDPIHPKKKENGNYPWEFKAPSYDNRASNSMKAGNNYGIGFKVPIGKEKPSFKNSPIPQSSKCFSPNDVMYGKNIEG